MSDYESYYGLLNASNDNSQQLEEEFFTYYEIGLSEPIITINQQQFEGEQFNNPNIKNIFPCEEQDIQQQQQQLYHYSQAAAFTRSIQHIHPTTHLAQIEVQQHNSHTKKINEQNAAQFAYPNFFAITGYTYSSNSVQNGTQNSFTNTTSREYEDRYENHPNMSTHLQSELYPKSEMIIWREPHEFKTFIMICDIVIEMDYTDSAEYASHMKRFLAHHSPVISTKFDAVSRTVMLQNGTSGQRSKDFAGIVSLLRSKSDRQLYEISCVLSSFSIYAQATLANSQRIPEYKSMRVNAVNYFLEVQLKEMLEKYQGGYYEFQVFDFAEDPFNAFINTQGYSEKYIDLLGSNVDEIQSYFLRQNRLDYGTGEARKNACFEILQNLMEYQGMPCRKSTVITTIDKQSLVCDYLQVSHIELFQDSIVCSCILLVYFPREADVTRIKNVRRKQGDYMKVKQDLRYANQAKQFIEKFYQNDPEEEDIDDESINL